MKKFSLLLITLTILPFSISNASSFSEKVPYVLLGFGLIAGLSGGSYMLYKNYYKTTPPNINEPTNNTIDLSIININKTDSDSQTDSDNQKTSIIIPQSDSTTNIIPSTPPTTHTTPATHTQTSQTTPNEPNISTELIISTQPSQPIIIQKQKSRKFIEKWLLEEKNIEIMMGGY